VSSPVELRSMSFNSSDAYNLSGNSTITLSAITSTLYTSAGTHVVSAPVNVTGHLSICNLDGSSLALTHFTQDPSKNISKTGDGTLILNKIRATGVTLTSGVLQLMSNGGTSRVNNLQLPNDYSPILDLTNNAMIVDYTLRLLNTDPTKNNDPFLTL